MGLTLRLVGILALLCGLLMASFAFRGGNDLHLMGGGLICVGAVGLIGMGECVGILVGIRKNLGHISEAEPCP